jgi:PAS domain S-box-containing protein
VDAQDDEEERLRSVVVKNAESILLARQRAERELLAAKDTLERRTQELQQQREWFQVTLSSIGDAVIATDLQGKVTFLNPVAEAMTGWTVAEAVGQPLTGIFNIVNEETGQPVDNPVARVLQTGLTVGLANHTALVARNGTVVAVEDSAAPIRDTDGNIAGAVMVFHDVSERRQVEAALREVQARLDATLSAAEIGTWSWDIRKDIVAADGILARMFSVTPEVAAGASLQSYLAAVHLEDRPHLERAIADALQAEGSPLELDFRLVRPSGAVRWVTARGRVHRDEAGDPAYLPAVLVDITERKAAENARSMLAALVESSEDSIISKTLEGIITTWNAGAEHMFGYQAEEIIGHSVLKLIPSHLADEEPGILAKLKRGERIAHYETVRVRKDGSLLDVSLTVSPIKDAGGRIIGASKIARDITQKKRDEKSLQELFAAAQREIANRERAEAALRENDRRKDEFLATLAHELRNPLAPIRQAALVSKAPTATEAQKRWAHEVINRQVQNMALLLDDLLDISRVTRGVLELRKEPTELAAVVDAAVETARPILDDRRHTLSIRLPPEPVVFSADRLRLAQVLSNLLTNAAKYTDPQGHIELRAAVTTGELLIRVTDSGIGITAEALDRIFTMFSQVKSAQDRSEGGLGIGLALAKGLVELHGGQITAQSAGPGRGSEFTVRLPFIDDDHRRRGPADDAAHCQAPKRRVLIADDNRDGAESLAMLLRMQGHEVTVAHNGREALAAFDRSHPDVVLLDIGMPELDGYEVAREIRERAAGAEAMLIAVTGWGQRNDKERAQAAGFDSHFTKPVDLAGLEELLRQPRPSRPALTGQ